ncbi:MAG: GGDEF domain-containing protein, partial [Bacillati bacterium ANGP1]
RYRIPAAVVYLDLDKFKAVNDSLGHQAGDRLLIGIAEILKQNVRATDVAARLGGDEFALILTYTSLGEAKTVAERLAQAFREHHVSIGDQLVATTGSFGVVGIDRKSSVSDLMVAADLAMYAVKNRGGNGVSLVPLIA